MERCNMLLHTVSGIIYLKHIFMTTTCMVLPQLVIRSLA